jgi:hypothetical protein
MALGVVVIALSVLVASLGGRACRDGGDAGGAHAVAVRDGRQPLHVRTEHAAERLGLGLAQLRELVGHVGHGAVLLAELVADRELLDAGGVATARQHLGEGLGRGELGALRGDRGVVALDELDTLAGEGEDRLVSPAVAEEAQRLRGEVVVLVLELVAARLREAERAGRAATAAGARQRALLDRLESAGLDQVVEVTANARRGQVQRTREIRGRSGTLFGDQAEHARTRRGVPFRDDRRDPLELHNNSVTLIRARLNEG